MSVFSSMSPAIGAVSPSSMSLSSSRSGSADASCDTSPSSNQGISWTYAEPTATLSHAPTGSNSSCGNSSNNSQQGLPLGHQFPSAPLAAMRTPEPRHDGSDEGQSVEEDSTADGMTPTPSGKDPLLRGYGASDDLSDLLDDLDSCLPLGFDLEDLDAGDCTPDSHHTKDSNTPLFKTPAEASAYLKAPRSDVDMEVQRCLRTYEKSESLSSAVSKWQKEGQMGEAERAVSLKILVHEAANRSLKALKKRNAVASRRPPSPPPCSIDCELPAPKQQHQQQQQAAPARGRFSPFDCDTYANARVRTYSSWKTIEENVVSDACMYGYQTPQRHLSCMCIFNPTLTDVSSTSRSPSPLPCPYGENEDDRAMRSATQAMVIQAIKGQEAPHHRRQFAAAKKNGTASCSSSSAAEKPYLFVSPETLAAVAATSSPPPQSRFQPSSAAPAQRLPSWKTQKSNHYCL